MPRKLPLFIFLFLLSSSVFADLRDYVFIVRANIHPETASTFTQVADYFKENDESYLSDIFRGFTQGWHGTGFVYVAEDGENYIITNRHVAAQAKTIDITIQKANGTNSVYFNCPVIYADDKLDLAILQFPQKERLFTTGLDFFENQLSDGDEVWSAGFPGLLGRPGWQLAKGNITNSKTFLAELVDPAVSYVIQHSASIDPGNSGGPLLVKDSGTPSGYKVIGINTWSINNRQNTFFSIPVTTLRAILNKAKETVLLTESPELLRESLEKKCRIFAAELESDNSDWNRVKGFVSYEFVAYAGWDSFLSMLTKSNAETKEKWEYSFFTQSPIETMRSAIFVLFLNSIKQKYPNGHIQFSEINIADIEKIGTENSIRTIFLLNEDRHEIIWTFEQGFWRIEKTSLVLNRNTTRAPRRSNDISTRTPNPYVKPALITSGGVALTALSVVFNMDDILLQFTQDYDMYKSVKIGTLVGMGTGLVVTGIGISQLIRAGSHPESTPEQSSNLSFNLV